MFVCIPDAWCYSLRQQLQPGTQVHVAHVPEDDYYKQAIGITNKKKLFHHVGHYFVHQKNGLCNTVTIRFGRHIVDALADDLPSFAPHLRITGELMNVHR